MDIDQLIELCVNKCYFLDNILTWKIYNLGPIGLSIMVIPTECYLEQKKTQRLEEKSITLSSALNVSPKTFKRYVDGSHARFENKKKSLKLLEILNKQDLSMEYVAEF